MIRKRCIKLGRVESRGGQGAKAVPSSKRSRHDRPPGIAIWSWSTCLGRSDDRRTGSKRAYIRRESRGFSVPQVSPPRSHEADDQSAPPMAPSERPECARRWGVSHRGQHGPPAPQRGDGHGCRRRGRNRAQPGPRMIARERERKAPGGPANHRDEVRAGPWLR